MSHPLREKLSALRLKHGNYGGPMGELFDLAYEMAKALETIARPEALSAWIPMEERQPGRWDDVLVCFDHDGKPVVAHGLLRYDGQKFTIGISDYIYPGNVTHWMPLPLPPSPHVRRDADPVAALIKERDDTP